MIEYLDWWVKEANSFKQWKYSLLFLHQCPTKESLGPESLPFAAIDFYDWPVCRTCSVQLSDKDIDKIRFILGMKRIG